MNTTGWLDAEILFGWNGWDTHQEGGFGSQCLWYFSTLGLPPLCRGSVCDPERRYLSITSLLPPSNSSQS